MADFSDPRLLALGEALFGLGTTVVHNRNAALGGAGGGRGAGSDDAGRQQRVEALRGAVRRAVSRAPQVIVKITGGGRGAIAIARHFSYITRHGEVPAETEAGERIGARPVDGPGGPDLAAKAANRADLRELLDDWRAGGSGLPDTSHRREAFHVLLSMPAGTPPEVVRSAARDFARREFTRHSYLFALHTDTDDPHVHLVVKAEGWDGARLNPRKADLQRWRTRFAEALGVHGVEARAERAFVLGEARGRRAVWQTRRADVAPVARSERTRRYFAARAEALRLVADAFARSGGDDRAGDAVLARELRAHAERAQPARPAGREDAGAARVRDQGDAGRDMGVER